MQLSGVQVHLVQLQTGEFLTTQSMTPGQGDEQLVADPVTALTRGTDQRLNLAIGQILDLQHGS